MLHQNETFVLFTLAKARNLQNMLHVRGGSIIPCRRDRQPSGGGGGWGGGNGAPTYNFVKFSKKLHEIEKILGHRGAPPPNPPLHVVQQNYWYCMLFSNLFTKSRIELI